MGHNDSGNSTDKTTLYTPIQHCACVICLSMITHTCTISALVTIIFLISCQQQTYVFVVTVNVCTYTAPLLVFDTQQALVLHSHSCTSSFLSVTNNKHNVFVVNNLYFIDPPKRYLQSATDLMGDNLAKAARRENKLANTAEAAGIYTHVTYITYRVYTP